MNQGLIQLDVREVSRRTSVMGIKGEVTTASEGPLMEAYGRASGPATANVLLDFTSLEYMNSGGIGMLVTLLVRANRQRQHLLAYGLSDHYRQIFELTRLDEAIGIYGNEADALAAAGER